MYSALLCNKQSLEPLILFFYYSDNIPYMSHNEKISFKIQQLFYLRAEHLPFI